MKLKSVSVFFIFCLSPLLSLPFILIGMYERKRAMFVYFSFFMALVSYLTFPASDLYRHFRIYMEYIGMSFDMFVLTLPGDFLTQSVSFLFAKLGVPYDYCRFVFTVVFYVLILKVFNLMINESSIVYTNKEYFKRLLIYLMFVDYFTFVIGVRSGFATTFYLLGIYYLIENISIFKSLSYFVIAMCVHYSMLYLIILSICLSVVYSYVPKNKWMIGLVMLVFSLSANFFISYVESYFIVNDMNDAASYFGDGIWGTGDFDVKSTRGMLFSVMRKSIVFILISFWFFNISKKNYWDKWIAGLVSLYLLSFSLVTLSSRIYLMLIALLSLYICKIEMVFNRKIKNTNILLFTAIFSVLIQLFSKRDFLRISDYERLILPVPYILSQHYDFLEIHVNLDSEENIKR